MKRLIVSVLLLLVATLVFSQAKSHSPDENTENVVVQEQPVQKKVIPIELTW